MTAPRIGDRDLARSPRETSEKKGGTSSVGERVGAALASPLGVLLVIPGLVAALGLVLTFFGQRALRQSSEEVGRDRFAEQTGFVARSIAVALSNADPTLDRMSELVLKRSTSEPSEPSAPLAHALAGLIRGRPGMSYASVSYPDGHFQGSFLDADGSLRFQESWLQSDGTLVHRYDLDGTDRMRLRETAHTDYDPRKRIFYRVALETKVRTWTKPYPFFENHYTGVTRVEPIYERGELRAVLTADFDVSALSASIERVPLPGAKTLLYTKDGVILAFPEGAERILALPLRLDHAITIADLGDPVLQRFFESVSAAPPPKGEFISFTPAAEPELAMVSEIPRFPELGWSIAAIVPEATFFRAQRVHQRQSLIVAGLAVALGLGVALVFARHVVRVRRDMARVENIAREATARARELGSYRLIERLGAGGMGEVWRAEHRLLARQAAIKLIRKEALETAMLAPEELRERFRLEAQTLAMLRSRHTIELFDYGVTEDGTFFFVMELLDGIDLETLVTRYGPQPPSRVIQLLVQACRSLGEAHHAGLVHRDIKPANLFVCRAADEVDVVKVLDFGLVHAEQRVALPEPRKSGESMRPSDAPESPRLTQAGQYMGTPAFMAPEQGLGHHVDGRSDLYALGCTAIYLLSGKLVYEGHDNLAIIMAHLTKPIPDLRTLVPGMPEALERVIVRCLQKDRDDRPADAKALIELLEAVELPSEDIWTESRARAWWDGHIETKRAATRVAANDPEALLPTI